MASLHKIHNGILSFKENTPHLFKIILDKTIRDGKLVKPKTEETENDPTLEILDGILPCDRTKRKSPLQFPQPHKIMKIESSSLTYPTARKVEDQVQVDLAGKRGYGVMSSQKDISSQMGLLQGHRDCNELIQIASCSNPPGAIEAANEFTSNHPFFKVVMSSSYIETGNLVRFSSNMHSFKGKRKINSRLYIIRKIARQPMGISSMVLSCI
ncbi:conserved hypothetical protein [Ricinus communis]|uniref:Uncharacterized protein n=1 Tax=Ricinus communis TaxID=3988 RepID=B9T229_RICCO|nr:conserved hypothetical protein [Ricinus communis]